MIFGLTPLEMGIIFVVMSIGATVQGAIGYGMALVAGPIMLLIEPRFIPGPLTLAAFGLVLLVILRDRQGFDLFGLRWAILGMLAGMGLATLILKVTSSEDFSLIFGVLILLAVLMSVIGVRFQPRKPVLIVAGFFAGLMGLLTTTAGPPIALVYQESSGQKLRATISGFFVIGTFFALGSLVSIGRLGLPEIELAGVLLPGILVGFLISNRVVPWVDRAYTRQAVLAVATLSAVTILISLVR